MRLKPIPNRITIQIANLFLFQIGAIKTTIHASNMHRKDAFLFQIGAIKTENKRNRTIQKQEFLFQIGAIKTRATMRPNAYLFRFLFQIGAIKTQSLTAHHRPDQSFYSRLVRLKLMLAESVSLTLAPSFYSRLVRLKRKSWFSHARSQYFVSIPDWCD